MGITFKERNKRREIRKILYRLRRRWGVPADLYQTEISSVDLDTGKASETKTKVSIPQFITWVVSNTQKFEYDLAFIAANKNFTYGALFEIGDRIGIIDGIYLPTDFKVDDNTYVVYDATRYEIQGWDVLDAHTGLLLHLRRTQENKPGQIIERTVFHTLDFVQAIGVSGLEQIYIQDGSTLTFEDGEPIYEG